MSSSGDRCYALALSGGGSNGAWEAGVIWGLHHYGNINDYAWQVVTGVSAGSMNTTAIVSFAPDDMAMSEYISNIWATIEDKDVWQLWGDGVESALF